MRLQPCVLESLPGGFTEACLCLLGTSRQARVRNCCFVGGETLVVLHGSADVPWIVMFVQCVSGYADRGKTSCCHSVGSSKYCLPVLGSELVV
jgi:hypothetical protein